MPLLKHAIKKMRQDARKRKVNKIITSELKSVLKRAVENPNPENINMAFSKIDRAVKVNLLHKNTAARKKSSLAKNAKSATNTSKKLKKPTKKK
jgi:small subunit ribosomal protein S20